VLAALSLLGTIVALALPGLAVALVAKGRRGDVVLVAWLIVVSWVLLADALIYGSFARHLVGLVGYASADRHWDVVGGAKRWITAGVTDLVTSTVCVAIGIGVAVLADRVGSPLRARDKLTNAVSLAAALALVSVTALCGPLWASNAAQESTFDAFLVDLRLLRHPGAESGQVAVVEAQLSGPVLALRQRIADRSRKACRVIGNAVPPLPSIVIVVVESFRSDVVTDELMPRLARFARSGLALDAHLAGSVLSEAGLFALLYSESPLLYDAALDARRKPCALSAVSSLGYRTGYFSGQPEKWRRAEEFVGPAAFDEYHHDDGGTWAEWDQRALRGAVDLVRGSDKPVFAVAYLMSSHFEYRFPEKYAVDRPVESTASWPATNMRTLGGDEAPVFRNRYRNTMRFLDDLVMDAVGALDPLRTLVVITGDHGESLFDDGRFGHGYSFADVIAKTPAIVAGPGVAPSRRGDPTLHVDLLPTVVHAATSGTVHIEGIDGHDLLDPALAPRDAVLLAAQDGARNFAIAELRDGVRRLDLQIRLGDGSVTWDGLRDPLGRWAESQRVDPDARRDLVRAFDAAVGDIAKP
jgi:hypothetical protein